MLRRLPSKHRGHTLDSLDIETTRDLSKAAVKSEYHSYQYVDDNATDPGYGYAVLWVYILVDDDDASDGYVVLGVDVLLRTLFWRAYRSDIEYSGTAWTTFVHSGWSRKIFTSVEESMNSSGWSNHRRDNLSVLWQRLIERVLAVVEVIFYI